MSECPPSRCGDELFEGPRHDESQKWEAGVVDPKDQARQWLAERIGRNVHVETRFVDSTATPIVNAGLLRSQRTTDPEIAEDPKDLPDLQDRYEVGTVSYNLADLSDEIEVHVRTEPAEQLELIFNDGTSLLITATITVTGKNAEG
jgi:hypothetical protein